jgi:fatty acid desaturase
MLWPSFGGHWIDLLYLNALRPRLPASRTLQCIARLAVWFGGGILLAGGVQLTLRFLVGRAPLVWLTWAIAGALFVAIELVAHAALHLRGRPSFYNGLG